MIAPSQVQPDERREHSRHPKPPLYVRANGKIYQSCDWSEGNLLLDSGGDHRVCALITIDAVGLQRKDMSSVEIHGRVERVTPDGDAAVNFLHRDDFAASAMRFLMDSI